MEAVFNSDDGIEAVLKHFVDKQLINEESPSIDIFDIDYFKARMKSLKEAFPEDFFLHALALKGNYLVVFSHPFCTVDSMHFKLRTG